MKKAIYTCLFGNYDTLNPAPKFEGWDTILFTDTRPSNSKGWEVRLTEGGSPKLDSRCYKFLSHIHLPEYDLVCYQDANIILTEGPPSVPMWLRHPRRKKVSEEIQEVLKKRKAHGKQLAIQMAYYRKQRFPDNAGLFQNGFFVRSNRSERMNKLMELTFDIYAQFPTRDQIALPFASWKLGIKPEGATNYYLKDSQIQFLPHDNEPKPIRVQVHHITPARSDKNFGLAVNQAIEGLPENDWICLRDIDTVPPYHEEFIKQIEEIANNPKGFSLIGCMTNRLGLPWQLVPNMFNEKNMDVHRAKAKELAIIKTIKPLTGLQTVGGLMMLFSKSTWRKAGKFPEGGIEIKGKFVDYHFSKAVSKFAKLGIAENVYLFHMYRWDAKDTRTEKSHLK
jgi:hypothetical protein